MKKIIAFAFFCSLFIILEGKLFAQNSAAKDIFWNEENKELSYFLPKDSIVKIRVGRESGPVYETPVNLKERKAGKHKEAWSGKGAQGKIDFLKFGHLHFCVDAMPKLEKDLELLVDLPPGVSQETDAISVEQDLLLEIDIIEEAKKKFGESGFEVRTFLDGDLVRVDNARGLPYRLKLNLGTFPAGEHLLTINAWPLPERTRVAYKNMMVITTPIHTKED